MGKAGSSKYKGVWVVCERYPPPETSTNHLLSDQLQVPETLKLILNTILDAVFFPEQHLFP